MRGVAAAEVLFASDLLKVRYCPQYLPRERIVERVASLGYRAAEYTGSSAPADAERKDLLLRTGIAAFLSMNVMMFSLVVYASYFEPITAGFGRYIPFLLMALATPSRLLLRRAHSAHRLGRHARRRAAHGIAARHGHPDWPTGTAPCRPSRGGNHVYFDTACAIVTLVLTGKVIERGAKEKTSARAHPALPPDAQQGAAHGGWPRAFRLRRCPAARLRLPREIRRAHSGRRHRGRGPLARR